MLRDVHDVVLSVHRRAVRNYPWSSQLWSDYLLALVRTIAPHSGSEKALYLLFLGAGIAHRARSARYVCFRCMNPSTKIFSRSIAVFEKSLQAGMVAAEDFVNVFQTYTDFLRRRLSSDGMLAASFSLDLASSLKSLRWG